MHQNNTSSDNESNSDKLKKIDDRLKRVITKASVISVVAFIVCFIVFAILKSNQTFNSSTSYLTFMLIWQMGVIPISPFLGYWYYRRNK